MPSEELFDKIRLPFWEHLNPEEKNLIKNRLSRVKYSEGQTVRDSSMDCIGLIYILKGSFRASLLSPDGREMMLYRIKAGELCVLTASCVLDTLSFDTRIVAAEETETALIPIDVYSRLVRNNIYVECFSYKNASERFSEVIAGVERIIFLNLEQRLASYLVDEMAEKSSDMLYVTHEQIAQDIGSAREAVSRSLKRMAERGLVELSRGGIKLRDKQGLYSLVG